MAQKVAAPGRCERCGQRSATKIGWGDGRSERDTGLVCAACPPYDNVTSYGEWRVLIRRSVWDALPEDQKRRGRTPAHETQYGSAVASAHDPEAAPAILTLDRVSGASGNAHAWLTATS